MSLPTPDPGPRLPSPLYGPPYETAPRGREIELRDLGRGVLRHRWLILGIAGVVTAIGGLVTWLQPSEYEAETTIHVQTAERSGVLGSLGQAGGLGAALAAGSGSTSTEIAVLRSRSIAESVADSLKLRVLLIEPEEVPRSDLIEVVAAARDSAAGVYELTRLPDGRYRIRAEEEAPAPQPRIAAAGEPIRLAGATIRVRTATDRDPDRIRVAVLPFRAAAERVREGLEVDQLEGGAQVLSLRLRHRDPWLAPEIPNAVAHSYVEYKTRTNTANAGSSVRFLQEQVDRYAADLAAAEARLQRFSEGERIVSLPDQASAQVRQVADLQARRDLLMTEREALREILTRADAPAEDPTAPSPYRRLATFPTFLSNGIVQNLVSTLTNLETERSRLLGRFTPQHPDVVGLSDRIGDLESQLYQIASNYGESLDSQIASMEGTLARFGGQLEAAPARQVEYARLQRERSMLEEIYTLLETRLTEARIREAGEPVDVRVLDRALVPQRPASPRPLLALVLAAVTGLMLGLGVASVRAILDPRVRSRDDVIAAAGGAPVIAAIPRVWVGASGNGHRRVGRRAGTALELPEQVPGRHPHLVVFHNPASPAAEAYRSLRTSVMLLDPEQSPRVIVATSAMPGEGKSVSASNLAVALAQQGTRTLLIDADLRQGGLHRVFGIPREPGLADVLLSRAEPEKAIREVAVSDHGVPLDVLVSGGGPPNPSELLGSGAMLELLTRLRADYDMIVLDAPPLRVVTDAVVLGTMADATLLVARAGSTHKRALAEAAAELQRLNIRLGGVVVNDVDGNEMPAYRYV